MEISPSDTRVSTGIAAAALGFHSRQALVHHARRMPATAARREGHAWRINVPAFAAELRRRRLVLLPLGFEVRPAPGALAGTVTVSLDGVTCHLAWHWEGGALVLQVPEALGPGASRPALQLAPEVETRVRERIAEAAPLQLLPSDRRSRRRKAAAPARSAQP